MRRKQFEWMDFVLMIVSCVVSSRKETKEGNELYWQKKMAILETASLTM